MSDSQSGSESDEVTGTQSSNGYNSTMQSQQSSEQSSRSSDDTDEDVPLSQKVKRSSSPLPSSSGNGVKRRRESSGSEEDVPLSHKKNGKVKEEPQSDDQSGDHSESDYSDGDDSDYGNSKKKKKSKTPAKKKTKAAAPPKSSSKKKRKKESDDEDEDSDTGDTKRKKKKAKKVKKEKKEKKEKGKKSKSKSRDSDSSPTKGSPKKKVKEEDQEHIWKWWADKDFDINSDLKWHTLEHKGPVFAPPYEPLPAHVKFFYEKKAMKLSESAEEVATFYAKMLDHEYVTKDIFNKNFFKDWRKFMSSSEKEKITDLKKCDFSKMNEYFKEQSEIRKNMSKEEKKKIKEANDKLNDEYGIAKVDGHVQKIGNFRLEPPGLFRGRGNHPKMGKVKNRIMARDIIINIGKKDVNGHTIPVPAAPPGQKWKEVRHDQKVTWLASWTENIMGNVKYIMLNPSSKLKSVKDYKKYQIARKLHQHIDRIRDDYKREWKDREMFHRQRAVALYFIDRLALRAGNEKDDSEAADTVGCCSLRVEHIKLYDEIDGQQYVIEFDFLGKDSIRYFNRVPVEKQVFKNMKHFMEGKGPGDDLFDRLDTMKLNKHLNTLMEDGLSAKVFRTYNASITLERELKKLMSEKKDMSLAEKILAYNRANRSVAILCNHQRTVPKGFEGQMEKLKEKITAKEDQIHEVQSDMKRAKKSGDETERSKLKKKLKTLQEQLEKLKVQETDKEENKQIALGTSKLNYLDPRITVAWCKKYEVPIEKVYTKTHRDKFLWAIEMAGPDYEFQNMEDEEDDD